MGYIILRNGRVPGDPKWNAIGFLCLFIWLIGLLLMPEHSDSVLGKVICIVWIAIPIVFIGLFILYSIFGIIIFQLYSRFPDAYEKFPKWIKNLSDKYIL